MNVLSTFNGMGCIWIALDRLGIKVDKRYSSEIDKYASQVNDKNYPDTIQLGDVTKLKAEDLEPIDLLVGGSPCQDLSLSKPTGEGLEGSRSGLFYEYIRLLKECKPKYFLLENVRMKKEWEQIITDMTGVKPIEINSNLVSAQNRRRLYWTNIPNVTKPIDKKIFLKDIWDGGEEITERVQKKPLGTSTYRNTWKNMVTLNDKSKCLTASGQNISNASCTNIDINGRYYKLSPIECERLQNVPDKYTEGVSNTQRYKMLGNGWTVDVITHLLKGMM
jgi:DNA (cytosine-5)-methyltransferase 3A